MVLAAIIVDRSGPFSDMTTKTTGEKVHNSLVSRESDQWFRECNDKNDPKTFKDV